MRWLLVSSQHHPSQGGIGAYVAHFVRAATKAGWRVELITRPSALHPPGALVHNVVTSDMAEGFSSRLSALRHIERVRPYRYALWSLAAANCLLQMDERFDAVEFVDSQAEGHVSLASRRVRGHFAERGTPMIVHAHTPMFVEEQINGADMQRFGRPIYHGWERRAILKADGMMCASDLLRRRLGRIDHATVMPYPLDLPAFEPHRRIAGTQTLLLIGSVQPRKGVDVWAKSLNCVLRMHERATAVLVGSDTPTAPGGSSMADYVVQLIDPELRTRFRYAGPKCHTDVELLIRDASMVVVPSRFDNSPFVVAESLARGTPVIVSDQVGWSEHIRGLPTVPAGSVNALADIQCAMLEDEVAARNAVALCRSQLAEACDPASNLRQREAMASSLRSSIKQSSDVSETQDEMEIIADFLRSVEEQEESLAMSSSAGS